MLLITNWHRYSCIVIVHFKNKQLTNKNNKGEI